jgi:hypothetical protein
MSGRSSVTVASIDSSGAVAEATFFADVFYQNEPPQLTWQVAYCTNDTWLIGGHVTDADDDVRGMIVEFSGVFAARATVQDDGTFEFSIIIDPIDWGWESAFVLDWHGAMSDSEDTQIILN